MERMDLQQLGEVMVQLGTRGCEGSEIATMVGRYSDLLVTIVKLLMQGQLSAQALLEKCSLQVVRTVNSALATSDYFFNSLVGMTHVMSLTSLIQI